MMAFSGFPHSSSAAPILSSLHSSSLKKQTKLNISSSSSPAKTPGDQNWTLPLKDVAARKPTILLQEERLCMDRYEEKVHKVRALLLGTREKKNPMESLTFIDTIQRLGIDSHFQEEIGMILRQCRREAAAGPLPLRDVSLSFRLQRQEGHHASAELFDHFKNREGRLLLGGKDVRGLMELYEAAQLSVEGEDVLDEAAKSSAELLKKIMAEMDNNSNNNNNSMTSRMVWHTLNHPVRKSLMQARLLAPAAVGFVSEEWRDPLTALAATDLHIAQFTFHDELLQVSRWWKELGVVEELKHARNQPVKWYTWAMAILIDDVRTQTHRVHLTKSIAFIYLIDDIFDLYGTIHHLTLFTQAVNQWEYGAMEELPEYMKTCYKALLDTTNMIAHKIYKQYGFNPIHSLKAAWGSLCRAFLEEAKWFASGSLPTAEVYLENGKVSSGVHVVLLHLFFLLGLGGGGNANVHFNEDDTISSVAAILRLWDDLGSAKDEKQDGEDGSYIECYMKEHCSSSMAAAEEEARQRVVELIEREWKKLNAQTFGLHDHHQNGWSNNGRKFKKGCLNLARMVPLMYTYDDNQGLPLLQDFVRLMLSPPSVL